MGITDIFSLAASIGAVLSALFAAIACWINLRYKKPKIKIDIHQEPQKCYFVTFQKSNGEIARVAYMAVSIYNSSAVGGTIASLSVLKEKSEYSVETINSNYNPEWLKIKFTGSLQQDADKFRLRVPFAVPAFYGTMGYFLIPDFPIVNAKEVFLNIEYKLVVGKLKIKRLKKIKFVDMTPNCNYNYLDDVRDYSAIINYAKFNFIETSNINSSLEVNSEDYKNIENQ